MNQVCNGLSRKVATFPPVAMVAQKQPEGNIGGPPHAANSHAMPNHSAAPAPLRENIFLAHGSEKTWCTRHIFHIDKAEHASGNTGGMAV